MLALLLFVWSGWCETCLCFSAAGYAVEQAAMPAEQHQQHRHQHQQHPSTAPAPLLTQHSSQHYAGPSQQQQQHHQLLEQHSAALAAAIMSGLKPALLDTDGSTQLIGCKLLAAAAARAPALLLQQLVAADACEHLFEVIRGTLSSCSMSASILALRQQQQQQPQGVAAGHVVAEDLQSAAVAALQCHAAQGAQDGCMHAAGLPHGLL